MYQFKRQPRAHQLEAFELCKDSDKFALFMQMRTGKSKITLDKAGYLYTQGRINLFVVIAPNGVHSKWVKDDVPADIPDYISYKTAIWKSGNKKAMAECEELFEPGQYLRILAMNVEAFQFKNSPAEKFLKKLLNACDAFVAIDESHTIGNHKAKRTETLTKLCERVPYKVVLTGTPLDGTPLSAYAQFGFLDYEIFNQSFFSYKATYAELLPPHHPTMIAIASKGVRFLPQVEARDQEGKPIYKNIDKLKDIVRPYSYFCRLEDCDDIPENVYDKIYYELDPKQRRVYKELTDKLKSEVNGHAVSVPHRLTLLMRQQQILSGFLPSDDEDKMIPLFDKPTDNPRIKALMTLMESMEDESVIIWCRFQKEIEVLEELFGDQCVTHYGKTKDRELSKHLFRSGKKRILLGNVATGGLGLDFSGTYVMVFFSNTFRYIDREQAEFRQKFIGQMRSVLIVDIEAEDTVDNKIVGALRDKKNVENIFYES
jgi:SNF2 family DNA or RNA helicase